MPVNPQINADGTHVKATTKLCADKGASLKSLKGRLKLKKAKKKNHGSIREFIQKRAAGYK